MRIIKGNKTIDIPNWALLVGALVVDNVVANLCKTSAYKKLLKTEQKGS